MNPYAPPTARLGIEPRVRWFGLTWLEFFLALFGSWTVGLYIGMWLVLQVNE